MIYPLILSAFLVSLAGTGVLRRYALAHRVLDVPNERSSHQLPMPRGGGVAIVVSFLGASSALAALGRIPASTTWAIVVGGSIVAAVGFVDDHRHLSARWRLLAHFTAAIWAVVLLMDSGGELSSIGIKGLWAAVAVVAIVWLLNLYNFMDGIDGLAGIQAVTVGLAVASMHLVRGSADVSWWLPAIMMASAAGFLVWNFPPAKIFMGDAGSGFVGFVLGVLALADTRYSPDTIWGWVILLAVFVTDATVTLCRRAANGERIWEAHRTHAYQIASRRAGGHRPVTLVVAAINLGWLLPLSLLAVTGRMHGAVAAVIAYAPLLALGVRIGAGRRDR
jgi:Fuc2NAc and GlcNAc transferase